MHGEQPAHPAPQVAAQHLEDSIRRLAWLTGGPVLQWNWLLADGTGDKARHLEIARLGSRARAAGWTVNGGFHESFSKPARRKGRCIHAPPRMDDMP